MNPFAAAALSLHAAAAGHDPLLTEVFAGLTSRPKYLYPSSSIASASCPSTT
jgi:hypothetical protein